MIPPTYPLFSSDVWGHCTGRSDHYCDHCSNSSSRRVLRQSTSLDVPPRPTKGWPCELLGPRASSEVFYPSGGPGGYLPPQAPNLWVDFEKNGPKILGPAYSFFILIRNALKISLSSHCFRTLSDPAKTIFYCLLLLFFVGLRFIPQKSVFCLGFMLWRSVFCSLEFKIHWVHRV
jgi:hypothetical protein